MTGVLGTSRVEDLPNVWTIMGPGLDLLIGRVHAISSIYYHRCHRSSYSAAAANQRVVHLSYNNKLARTFPRLKTCSLCYRLHAPVIAAM